MEVGGGEIEGGEVVVAETGTEDETVEFEEEDSEIDEERREAEEKLGRKRSVCRRGMARSARSGRAKATRTRTGLRMERRVRSRGGLGRRIMVAGMDFGEMGKKEVYDGERDQQGYYLDYCTCTVRLFQAACITVGQRVTINENLSRVVVYP